MIIKKKIQPLLKRYILKNPVAKKLASYPKVIKKWNLIKTRLEAFKPADLPTLPEEMNNAPALTASVSGFSVAPPGLEPPPSCYQQYHCTAGNPLNCVQAWQSVQSNPGATACDSCGFPAPLAEQSIVVGNQGNYRVGRFLGQRGMARLYAITQMGTEIPMTLREYLLPKRYFNEREQAQRQDMFLNWVGLNLADGRSQDLRAIAPIEAIAPPHEERAYLVLPVEEQAPTLSQILANRPPFTSAEVFQVLRQVLQTLSGLHQQKYALSPGRIQAGVIHGNIRLSSLLWVTQGSEWFIYLTSLAIWEECFSPTVLELPYHNPQEDLAALGSVAFYLLAGSLTDPTGQRLNPKLAHHWPTVYPPLKHFILRLLAVEVPFSDAAAAHQALLQLPPEPITSEFAAPGVVVTRPQPWWWRYGVPIILWTAAIALGGWFLWSIVRPKPMQAQRTPPTCCFKEVGAVPEGSFTYTAIAGDVWEQVLLAPSENPSLTVEQQLAAEQPKLQLTYQSSNSVDEALEKLRTRQADFAVLPLLKTLPIDMAAEVIAHDGLAVVVAFNYEGRSQGLPDSLRGSLSLETVRQLYQNQIDSWHEVKSSIDLPVKLYANQNPATQAALQHLILQDEETSEVAPTQLDTIPMLRSIIRDFEDNQIGSIGITSLSSIEGQCSVYPLAIQEPGQAPSQPFQSTSGETIQPTVDLCRRKGMYHIAPEVLRSQTYPLAYPIAIVYRRDNRLPPIGPKVAALFLTDEGQSYLQQINLVEAQ